MVHSANFISAMVSGHATDVEQRARAATGLGHVSRAWALLQDSKRVLRGEPSPGSMKPGPKAKPQVAFRSRPGFSELHP